MVVIAGIGLVWAGETWNIPWLVYADALAGLGVAGVILWVGSQLGKRTIEALLEPRRRACSKRSHAPSTRMDGVLDVVRVRVRRAGNRHFVDATVSVPRTASLEQVHALSDAIEKRIGEIAASDVIVHPEPRAPKGEHLFEAIRAVAQRMGLAIHDLSAIQQQGTLSSSCISKSTKISACATRIARRPSSKTAFATCAAAPSTSTFTSSRSAVTSLRPTPASAK